MSKYVFFIQLEPDIDHTTPVAYRLNQVEPNSVTLICVNPMFDIASDYRLIFLKEKGVRIIYLSQLSRLAHLEFYLALKITRLPKFILMMIPGRIWPKFYFNLRRISPSALTRFFKQNKTKVVTIDEGQPSGTLKTILSTTRNLKINSVKLTTANPMRIYPKVPDDSQESKMFNYYMLPQDITPFGKLNIENPKEVIMGCMRYCLEWEKIHADLLRHFDNLVSLSAGKNKLKILIFERSSKKFLENHPVVKSIKELENVEVIFRARPRILLPKKLYKDSVNSVPSAYLIQWADIVICSISSICLDVLHYKKTLIYPKFIAPDEEASFEKYKVCWKVENESELIDAIKMSGEDKLAKPYNENDVQSYFEKTIYNHDKNFDVLKNYQDFYQSISRG